MPERRCVERGRGLLRRRVALRSPVYDKRRMMFYGRLAETPQGVVCCIYSFRIVIEALAEHFVMPARLRVLNLQ